MCTGNYDSYVFKICNGCSYYVNSSSTLRYANTDTIEFYINLNQDGAKGISV